MLKMKTCNRILLYHHFYLKFGMNVGIRVTNSIREKNHESGNFCGLPAIFVYLTL